MYKKYYKATPYKKTGYKRVTPSQSKKVSSIRRQNRPVYFSAPSGELKFLDTTYNLTSNNTGAIQTSAVLVAQGAGESQRVGRKITIKKIAVKGKATFGAADAIRLIMYQDMQANGAAAAVTDILETDSDISMLNLANKNRFKVLRDIKLDTLNSGSSPTVYYFSENLICEIPIEFDGATGALTELKSNNIGFLLIGDQAAASTPGEADFTCRIRYTDY